MSLDIKYRPRVYSDILGQDAIIAIVRKVVDDGKAFQQSYLFSGPHGSGKTTLARILARAMQCENPQGGDPCDECPTCREHLETGKSADFVEFDAATNSGKADILRITDQIEFHTFTGNRAIYLFDECFTADTVLQTPEGSRTIGDLVKTRASVQVRARDLDSGEDCWTAVDNWFDHGEREVFEMDFGDGLVLHVTGKQLFYTTNRGWVEALDLIDTDDVVVLASEG